MKGKDGGGGGVEKERAETVYIHIVIVKLCQQLFASDAKPTQPQSSHPHSGLHHHHHHQEQPY